MGVKFPGKKRYVTLEWPPRKKSSYKKEIIVQERTHCTRNKSLYKTRIVCYFITIVCMAL